eukprot:TRINITY_DN3407_c0_g1_i2.p1 TRINITY_DN3407_c0_g1~~TRINITY_DN3407_c0_g1_i2.p1  ORF type:complete len:138 (+),score=10.09 TRINITY_DN3407_c0_g1_i2:9-422(+)
MSTPVKRLGEESGWTTVFYYSKHTPERREIWRDQWKKRADIYDSSVTRYHDDRERIYKERNQRKDYHTQDLESIYAKTLNLYSTNERKKNHQSYVNSIYQGEKKNVQSEKPKRVCENLTLTTSILIRKILLLVIPRM